MKRVLSGITALFLYFSFNVPSVSSYGGGGIPPNVMLERQNVRIYAPSHVKKSVKKQVTKKKRTMRKRTSPKRSQGAAVTTAPPIPP